MQELDRLLALADPDQAQRMAAYHKAPRLYLGIGNPAIELLVREWRAERDLAHRIALAARLWQSDIHEARIAAARLLTQARIPDDGEVWRLIRHWADDFDGLAITDHAMIAGQKRLIADPVRLDDIQPWLLDANIWKRRAVLTGTLPWAKMNHPRPDDLARRERILGWAASLADQPDWCIQKAIATWLHALSKRDTPRICAFLDEHGARMQPFARREAARHLNAHDTTRPIKPASSSS